jgi:hypothetical protein
LDSALLQPHACVLVHCQAGVSRSVTVVVAYLMRDQARKGVLPSLETCLAHVSRVRPSAKPNAGFLDRLSEFHRVLQTRYPIKEVEPDLPRRAIEVRGVGNWSCRARVQFLANVARFHVSGLGVGAAQLCPARHALPAENGLDYDPAGPCARL